jgi:hypothetical protein
VRPTWKDLFTGLLAALTLLVLLAVTQNWGWPVLSSHRAAIAVVAVLGLAAGCGYAARTWSVQDPFILLASGLGLAALVLIVGGLIVANEAWLLALVVDLLALWVVSTLHHAVRTASRPRRPTATT